MKTSLQYAKNKQEYFSKLLESEKGIKPLTDNFNVPYEYILGLNTELYEIVNAAKVHKYYSSEKIDKAHVIEECADLLSWIGNTANFLGVDLIIDTDIQKTVPEILVIALNDKINRLTWNKRTARYTLKDKVLPAFVELVYSLGFSLEELEAAYNQKMDKNIQELIAGNWRN